jgi:flavorubredoxin
VDHGELQDRLPEAKGGSSCALIATPAGRQRSMFHLYCSIVSCIVMLFGKSVTRLSRAKTERGLQASVDQAELRAILGGSKGVVIMCPDSDNVTVKEALDVAFSEMTPKKHKVAIAESFGGNDEPVDKLSSDLIALGLDPVFTLRVKHDPTEQVCASNSSAN